MQHHVGAQVSIVILSQSRAPSNPPSQPHPALAVRPGGAKPQVAPGGEQRREHRRGRSGKPRRLPEADTQSGDRWCDGPRRGILLRRCRTRPPGRAPAKLGRTACASSGRCSARPPPSPGEAFRPSCSRACRSARDCTATPSRRARSDIDLLVPPNDFATAGRVLSEFGWRRTPPDFPATPARTRWCERVLDAHVFIGPGRKLDLHGNLLGNPFLFDPPFAELHADGAAVDVAGCRFWTPGDAHQLLYLACHGSLHGWERLQWRAGSPSRRRACRGP